MDLEFQESDIIFSSDHQGVQDVDDNHNMAGMDTSTRKGRGNKSKKPSSKKGKKKMMIHTVPIDIPCNFFQHKPGNNKSATHGNEFFDYDDDGEEMVPPHVIVGRRIAGKIAFSVCTGIGRTLKGRDLSEVRNSILRLTGFLES